MSRRIVAPVVLSLLFIACGTTTPSQAPGSPPAGTSSPPGTVASPTSPPIATTLKIALPGFENNLTPFTLTFGSLPNTHDMIMLVYDTLFWSQNDKDPEPWLAEKAERSTDGLSWTVTLRSGVKWHDGTPFTADDVKFTFEYYQKNLGLSGRYAHHVFDVPPFDHVDVVDPLTLKFFYKAPAPTFNILPGADLPIIPRHVWETITEPNKAAEALPVGTGPYKLVEIVPNEQYRFEANADYFRGKPTVDEIVMPIVPDPAAAFAALQTGQVDFVARNVPPELIDQFSGLPDLKVVQGTKLESTQLYFNARKAPLTDPKLRKAISLAIDGQALVDTVLLGHGRPGRDSFIHPDSPWAIPDGGHEFDAARATQMLDDAGYDKKDTDGVRLTPDGTRLEFSILVSSFAPQDLRVSQLVSDQVLPIGVKLKIEALDPATLRQRRQAPPGEIPTYDAYVSGLESHAHVDPDGLYYFFHSPGPKGFGGAISGYSNAEVDRLSERAAAELDAATRLADMYDIQRILAAEVPVIVYYYPDGVYAYRPAAYSGWLADPGHGILTKRSFLGESATGG